MKNLIEPQFENMKELLIRNLAICPSSPAIHIKTDENTFMAITYEQFIQDVFSLGTALINRGFKDKKIAIYGKNSYEWLVSYFAVFCGVGTVVPLDIQISSLELENALNRVESEAIIFSKETSRKVEEIIDKTSTKLCIPYDGENGITIASLIEEGFQLIKDGNKEYININIDSAKPLSYVFTSGTTSEPKVAMLSHKNIVFNIKSVIKPVPIYTNDVFYSILPFNHVLGTLDFSLALSMGGSIAICDNLKNIMKDFKIMRPTFTIIVPRVLEMLADGINSILEKKGITDEMIFAMAQGKSIEERRELFKELHDNFGGNLRVIIVGGAPMNPETAKRLELFGFVIRQGYGLTECAPLVAVNSTDENYCHDSVGQPIPGCDVKIVNPDEKGIGEVAVKGDQVMVGYYNDPISTSEIIREDGYLYTGDLGFMDRNKFIKLSGRNKNLIVLSTGKKISPEELESVIGTTDIIKEVIVSLEEGNNGREILTAEFEVSEKIMEEIRINPIKADEVRELIWEYIKLVNNKVSEYKRIRQIKIRETPFERTSSQKVKRHVKLKN